MIQASGIIEVDEKRSRIVVNTSSDILDYYHWFIKRHFKIRLHYPLHDAHITITNPRFHKNVNWDIAKSHNGKKIVFHYDPYVVQGGYTKGFIMFYLKVHSEELDKFKREINIVESDSYRGLHITIGQSGKGGSVHRLWWPEMITIKTK
jgi:hypothetical protein